jgi:E3 ubiquitin-protein ligase EDD1
VFTPAVTSNSSSSILSALLSLADVSSAAAAGTTPQPARHQRRRRDTTRTSPSAADVDAKPRVQLLSHRNANGETPFMYAVRLRAYEAALALLESASRLLPVCHPPHASSLTDMLWPTCTPAASPLYTLCANDTCSNTWTGQQHIVQDIYECLTCSLVGNLCCCSECARTCYAGHECRLKTGTPHAPPTAYCDCWETGACASLRAGDQHQRRLLLQLLLDTTNLLTLTRATLGTEATRLASSSHLFVYMTQTLVRQHHEQRSLIGRRQQVVRSSRKYIQNLQTYWAKKLVFDIGKCRHLLKLS